MSNDEHMKYAPKTVAVVFEQLPSKVGSAAQSYGLSQVLPQLRRHPMEWARVAEFDSRNAATYVAGKVNRGKSPAFGEDFAASVRMVDGRIHLYMRYVGDDTGPAEVAAAVIGNGETIDG